MLFNGVFVRTVGTQSNHAIIAVRLVSRQFKLDARNLRIFGDNTFHRCHLSTKISWDIFVYLLVLMKREKKV